MGVRKPTTCTCIFVNNIDPVQPAHSMAFMHSDQHLCCLSCEKKNSSSSLYPKFYNYRTLQCITRTFFTQKKRFWKSSACYV